MTYYSEWMRRGLEIQRQQEADRERRTVRVPSRVPDIDDFSEDELSMLQKFYTGVRARDLRKEYGVEPLKVVAKFRHLPSGIFEAVLSHWRMASDIK